MQWDWQNRKLRLSVGELARFSLHAPPEEGAGRWRMELGSHWHNVLRQRAEAESEGWQFEQPVEDAIVQGGWQFSLRGRIDQLNREGPEILVREIKTVSMNLPADEASLRAAYPQYFHQVMLYAFLLGKQGEFPQPELLFLEIQTGLTQIVRLADQDLQALHAHLTEVVDELDERRGHFSKLRQYVVPKPFPEWRPGQLEARNSLKEAIGRAPITLFEAPTGFGKTGLVLEQALQYLASGQVERILLLTGKNTGHTPLLKQLEVFRKSGHGLTIHALRSRADHALEEEFAEPLSLHEIGERWIASGLSAPGLLAEGILDLESVRDLGNQHGIPPWAISRMLLPYADIWIADFNYLFDPAVCSVLESIPTFSPKRTLLLVDEAHNLPERVAASHSHVLDASEVDSLLSEIQFARFPGPLVRLLDQLLSMLKKQPACDSLDPPFEADLLGHLRDIREALDDSSFGEDELSPENLEWLWRLSYFLADWDHPHLPMTTYCSQKGRVHFACTDAANLIAPVLHRFSRSILMSATLQPWEAFQTALGLGEQTTVEGCAVVQGNAPWLEGCFEVIVDARVDTRYREREKHLDTTARTIGETVLAAKGCTAVFFPSYRYAETVLERLQFHYPAMRGEIQPRNLNLEQQTAFLEEALRFDDVLFLVLGSRFSEGIDALGGRVHQAIVVSPALPEVNSLQRARESRFHGNSAQSFRSVYLIPGLRKISQALGRLVRTPDQRAKVLLHGKRFMEPAYQDLLPGYLQPMDCLVTNEDFASKWLKSM
ncbi:MAG: ATP-dependent DNA helicase [Puniceicoccaceae bacterium]